MAVNRDGHALRPHKRGEREREMRERKRGVCVLGGPSWGRYFCVVEGRLRDADRERILIFRSLQQNHRYIKQQLVPFVTKFWQLLVL